MPTTTDDMNRRAHIAALIHEKADSFGLARAAVADAAAQFTAAGGQMSNAPARAYLPSGASLDSWMSDQKEIAPHWFQPPAQSAQSAAKPQKSKLTAAQRRARATAWLAQENGDDTVKL
jgi:hypothetical protein